MTELVVNSTIFKSWFETIDGKELVNVKRLAEAFGKTEDDSIKLITRTHELFIGDHFEFTGVVSVKSECAPIAKPRRGRPQKDHYLTRNGCLMFVSQLEYQSYSDETKEFIVSFKRWLTQTAGRVMDGKLISPPNMDKLSYTDARRSVSDGHKELMQAVKEHEAPNFPGNSRYPYQRECIAINEDVAGVHVKGINDQLNTDGLRIKNYACVADIALIEGGVDFTARHPVVKKVLNRYFPTRSLPEMTMTPEEKARLARKCPETQKSIGEYTAVVNAC